MKKNKAIFLDRDGVINFPIIKNNQPFSPRKLKEFKIYKDFKLLKKFRKVFYLIVVTNQPDIKNRKLSQKKLNIFHQKINEIVKIDKFYICKHTDDDKCECRKPKTKFFFDAKKKFKLKLNKSYFIGDRWKDMKAGNKIKCKNIFIDRKYSETQKNSFKYDYKCNSFKEAIKFIDY